ncbi:unnamed protein product [Colias eurytheme]|nr:unnamed protein product [Colias eurytheme]
MRQLCRPQQLEIDMYWGKLRDVYNNYLEQHNPIMSHYQSLQEKDDFYQRDIARNDMQIQQASEMLITLQKEWMKMTNLMNYKIKRMNSHKEDLAKRYWQMKKDSKSNRRREDEDLAVMVDASQGAKKYLEDMLTKLQKINQMAQICSKYEHDNDKILKEMEDDELPQDFENLDAAMINECKEYSKMDKFLLKVNRARVQTICLRTEKNKLAKENIQLKQYIKKYLTDLALNDGKMRPHTTKLPSETNEFVPKINRPVTCIEGALSNAVIHEKRLQLEKKRNKEIGVVRSYPRVNCW